MAIETFYRFELAFSGEAQDVGILQGLEDTPLFPSVIESLYHSFDSLPVPPTLETSDDSAVVFLFTEKGVRAFADPINDIIYDLNCCDWQVIAMEFQLDPAFSLFRDEYQIAYSRTDLLELMWPADFDFHEVAYISTKEAEPLIYFAENNHRSLEEIVKDASAKSLYKPSKNETKFRDLDLSV